MYREDMHMAQTSILGRIGQLVRANVNAMLDQAEDPEKMLDQLIRDFTNNTAEADRFDALAKLALRRELSFEDQLRTFDTQISQQTELTDKLKDGLNKL